MYLLRDGCVYVKKSSGDGDNIQYVQYGDGDEEFCFKPSSTYNAQCQEEEEQTQVVPQGDISHCLVLISWLTLSSSELRLHRHLQRGPNQPVLYNRWNPDVPRRHLEI